MRYINQIAGALMMSAVAAAAGFNELPADAGLVVHVYDNVGVSRLEFATSKRQAATLLADAGIKVRFVDCRARPSGKCQDSSDPRLFVVSIENKVPQRLRGALGYASPYTERANRATLNYTKIVQTNPAQREYLLGTVIAHELAHLLFRSVAHGSGVMKEQWSQEDVKAMSQNRLSFSPEQVSQLQAGLQSRVTATLVAANRLP